ncbi:MAG: hypothetical protein JW770_03230 [Actinobacteria bacterium]|nr:hypothetical protein [Actinomycetota bacterium]
MIKINNWVLFYITLAIFLLGVSGLFFSRDFLSAIVSNQLMVIAAFINFLNFSFINPGQVWDRVFVLSGFIAIYLFAFGIILNIYTRANTLKPAGILFDFRLFIFRKSDWWGEDRI